MEYNIDLTYITQIYLTVHKNRLKNPYEINCGDCFKWSFLAFLSHGGKLISVDYYGGHAFIKIGNFYYDSESPKGVDDWRKLRFFNNKNPYFNYAKELSPSKFSKHWNFSSSNLKKKFKNLLPLKN